jgi:predicted Fe-Mo cluster-binding NifX family protein
MKVVVTSTGAGLDAAASPVFGRCRSYVFVDTDSMEARTVENPAMNAAGGAGIRAAQFVVEQGAEAVITGNVGPNAYNVLRAADVPVYLFEGETVRDAVASFEKDQLPTTGQATGPAHAGMGRRAGMGRGRGVGASGRSVSVPSRAQPQAASTGGTPPSREQEISEVAEMAADLRKQLAEVIDRLDQLEGEEE